MSTIADIAKAIFLEAVEKHSPNEWPQFLDQTCGADRELRGRVEGLLQAHDERDSLFDRVGATQDYQPLVRPGQMIGPYKIREQIGDGGMGVVYVAEQEKPLRRKVALKVIKPGMDSRAVLARFDAERNALALMNHPNIAKVLDAGTTEQGHPFFVMELIQGKLITEYCDQKKLTIPQRLELFTLICNAVQHAHQKGVIHRDIKPSNILVTEIDGKPVPKVIDFGVAKALGANLTDRTVYTSFQSLVGTPLYMSPEQTQLSGVDVDTSCDVYSLGILLYELLTGTTPLSPDELKQAAQDEILRRIRETEPPRPSNRISSLGETSSRISESRGAQPEQLGRLVRGDLDWIVMKALEKNRNRRYKTADAFAADIGRHLASEPVEARPPSTGYQLSRFYRRNWAVVNVAAGVLVLLVLGTAGTATGWWQAKRRSQELSKLADAFRNELIAQASEAAMMGRSGRAREYLKAAKLDDGQASHRHWQQMIDGQIAVNEGRIDDAISHFKRARVLSPRSVGALAQLAHAALMDGDNDRWLELCNELQGIPTDTAIDHLFKAQALSYLSGNENEMLNLIERYFAERSSPAAHLARARVLEAQGIAMGDPELLEKGILDTIVARAENPNSVFADWTSIDCYSTAIAFYETQGNLEMASQHKKNARQIALHIDKHNQIAQGVAAKFFNRYGETDQAEACYRRMFDLGARGYWLSDYALFLLEHDMRSPGTTNEIRARCRDFGIERISLALLCADDPIDRDLERHALRNVDPKLPRAIGVMAAAILRILGEDQQGVTDFLKYKTLPHSDPFSNTNGEESAMEYLIEQISAQELLAAAQGDEQKLSLYHTLIGMKELASVERNSLAELHLRHALEHGRSWADFYARAILSRLEANPDWPHSSSQDH